MAKADETSPKLARLMRERRRAAFADLGGDFVDAETGADSEGQVADYKISFPKSPLRFRPRPATMASSCQRHLAMKAIELIGDIDDQHRLHAQVPKELPAGQVRLIVLVPGEDEAGRHWHQGIAAEWSTELNDPREDIYTLDDGRPVNASR